MKLFKKEQAFSEYFSAFLRFRSNFAHFQKKKKKDDPHSWCISEFMDSEKHC